MKALQSYRLPRLAPRRRARQGRRHRRAAETRERIFRTALALFAKRGFLATTVEDITEASDVGKGTFFNYFPSKEHVLAAMGALQRSKIERAVVVAQKGRQPMLGVLRDMLRDLSKESGRSPAMFRSFIFAMLSSVKVRRLMLKNLQLGLARVAELIAIGQQRGEIRQDRSALELARVLQRSAFGAILFWSLLPPTRLTKHLDLTLDVFWSGARHAPTRSRKERRS
jgi:AcrR family transcriptional regulator